MLLVWKVRYINSRDSQFKDRNLWLDTKNLDPVKKAAVEMCCEADRSGNRRSMLRYRGLFQEEKDAARIVELMERHDSIESFSLYDYFEDENGKELTPNQVAAIRTGNPNTVVFPPGAKQHDIEFHLAPKPDVDLKQIQIPEVDLKVLAYFSRDFREMEASSFLSEGPGTLTGIGWVTAQPILKTAVSDDEIRSFVTIFRRLYMAKDPGNFLKASEAFARALSPHPVAKWVQGVAGEYEKKLNSVPDLLPFVPKEGSTFTRKRLIDVVINTQYAHQGKKSRERQYAECLALVDGRKTVLFWLFLISMQECALYIYNAGVQIDSFTEHYCKAHGLTPNVVPPAADYAGLGQLEKKRDREDRIFREKAEELAMTLWKNAGCPQGGPIRFFDQALAQLREATGKKDGQTDNLE